MKKVTKTAVKATAARAKRAVKSDAKKIKKQALHGDTASVAKDAKHMVTSDYQKLATDTLARIKDADYKKIAQDAIRDIDYKQLAKDALKVALPIAVMTMVAKRRKQTAWEENFEPLFNELKDKFKKMKF